MGARMAENLVKAGHSVHVFDVNAAAVGRLTAAGAVAAGSAKDAARGAEAVLLSLPNSKIVEDTVLGEAGVLAGASPGLLILDLSSITPKTVRMLAEKAAEKGCSFADAPVSGGVEGAEKGSLTIMVGCSEGDFERARPVLEALGKKLIHAGGAGAGATVKLVNNLLLGINMAAVGEAFALGAKAGIDPGMLYEIVSQSSGASYALTAKYEKYISKGNFAPGFSIDLQYKDLGLAVETAKDLGYPLLLGNVVQQLFEEMRAAGMGGEDISAIIKKGGRWG